MFSYLNYLFGTSQEEQPADCTPSTDSFTLIQLSADEHESSSAYDEVINLPAVIIDESLSADDSTSEICSTDDGIRPTLMETIDQLMLNLPLSVEQAINFVTQKTVQKWTVNDNVMLSFLDDDIRVSIWDGKKEVVIQYPLDSYMTMLEEQLSKLNMSKIVSFNAVYGHKLFRGDDHAGEVSTDDYHEPIQTDTTSAATPDTGDNTDADGPVANTVADAVESADSTQCCGSC